MDSLAFQQLVADGDLANLKLPNLTATSTPQEAREAAKETAASVVKEAAEVSCCPSGIFDSHNARPAGIIAQSGWTVNGGLIRVLDRQPKRRT